MVRANGEFRHLIRCKFLTPELIAKIFAETDLMLRILNFREDQEIQDYRTRVREEFQRKGVIIASDFYEESLRTRWSHEAAAHRLGAEVISTENAAKFSSMAKGESLEHAIRVISGAGNPTCRYADLIVMRHFEEDAAKYAMKVSAVPIINAGDGPGEHPTQALLDVYTIIQRFGHIDGLVIAMMGDLLKSRTIHSDIYLLARYGIKLYLLSDPRLRIKDDLRQFLVRHNVWFREMTDPQAFQDIAGEIDVLNVTRIQKNRFKMDDPDEAQLFRELRETYIVTRDYADRMKPNAIIMHPMPIESTSEFQPEVLPEVDSHEKAWYFKQAGYGVPIRMALIKMLLENWGFIERIEFEKAS